MPNPESRAWKISLNRIDGVLEDESRETNGIRMDNQKAGKAGCDYAKLTSMGDFDWPKNG